MQEALTYMFIMYFIILFGWGSWLMYREYQWSIQLDREILAKLKKQNKNYL